MRVRGRTDDNQPGIVRELRQAGFSVLITSSLGQGAPDFFCALRNRTVACEVKDPNKPPSERQLTFAERRFHSTWQGEVYVIESSKDVFRIYGLEK